MLSIGVNLDKVLVCEGDIKGIRVRTLNTLNHGGINNLSQLLGTPVKELFKIHGFGKSSLNYLEKTLSKMGLYLKHEVDILDNKKMLSDITKIWKHLSYNIGETANTIDSHLLRCARDLHNHFETLVK